MALLIAQQGGIDRVLIQAEGKEVKRGKEAEAGVIEREKYMSFIRTVEVETCIYNYRTGTLGS